MSSTGGGRKKIWGIEEISLIDDMYVIDQIVFSWTLSDDEKTKKNKYCWIDVLKFGSIGLFGRIIQKKKKMEKQWSIDDFFYFSLVFSTSTDCGKNLQTFGVFCLNMNRYWKKKLRIGEFFRWTSSDDEKTLSDCNFFVHELMMEEKKNWGIEEISLIDDM